MVTQISSLSSVTARAAGAGRPRRATALRYVLNVVATDVAEVVSGIGGWLFDCRMAGWNVGVALTDSGDDRALRILGLKAVDAERVWKTGDAEQVALTVISADRFAADDATRDGGRHAPGAVAVWGADCPPELAARFRLSHYRPSAAAQAFKVHSLTAAGVTGFRAGLPENIFREVSGDWPLDADLTPVG